MAHEEFEIEVDRQGQVTIKTIGIKGPRCIDAAEALAVLIGRQEARQLTSEYYESEIAASNRIDVEQRR